MLYDRWRDVVSLNSTKTALTVVATGESWTFGELDRLVADADSQPLSVVRYRASAEFFVDLLAAWRDGHAVLPLEESANPSCLEVPAQLPAGIAVVKRTATGSGGIRLIAADAASQIAEAEMLGTSFGLDATRVAVAAISPAHSYGFGVLVLPMLLSGMPLILPEAPLGPCVRSALDLVDSSDQVVLPGVPITWRSWSRGHSLEGFQGLGLSAGSPLTQALAIEVEKESGIQVVNLYGTSETGAVTADSRPPSERLGDGPVGAPLEGIELDVSEDHRIVVSGDSVANGYLEAGGQLEPFLAPRTMQTWDLGSLVDGNLLLSGYGGNLVNSAGRKVSPRHVEESAQRLAQGARVRAVAVPSRDPERHEEVALAVEGNGDAREWRVRLQASLQPWELPRRIEFFSSELWPRHDLSPGEWRRLIAGVRRPPLGVSR